MSRHDFLAGEDESHIFFSNNIISRNGRSNKFYSPLLRKGIVFRYYMDISGPAKGGKFHLIRDFSRGKLLPSDIRLVSAENMLEEI